MTQNVTTPSTMKTQVWKALAHAVPRMPPKKTYESTTRQTTSEPIHGGTPPLVPRLSVANASTPGNAPAVMLWITTPLDMTPISR